MWSAGDDLGSGRRSHESALQGVDGCPSLGRHASPESGTQASAKPSPSPGNRAHRPPPGQADGPSPDTELPTEGKDARAHAARLLGAAGLGRSSRQRPPWALAMIDDSTRITRVSPRMSSYVIALGHLRGRIAHRSMSSHGAQRIREVLRRCRQRAPRVDLRALGDVARGPHLARDRGRRTGLPQARTTRPECSEPRSQAVRSCSPGPGTHPSDHVGHLRDPGDAAEPCG